MEDIEDDCVPWHFLAERQSFYQRRFQDTVFTDQTGSNLSFLATELAAPQHIGASEFIDGSVEFPTLAELNEGKTVASGEGISDEIMPAEMLRAHYLERDLPLRFSSTRS